MAGVSRKKPRTAYLSDQLKVELSSSKRILGLLYLRWLDTLSPTRLDLGEARGCNRPENKVSLDNVSRLHSSHSCQLLKEPMMAILGHLTEQ